MEDTFDMEQLTGEARVLFNHAAAQAHFGASVFWRAICSARRRGAGYCRVDNQRDGTCRGIIDIIEEKT